MYILIHLVGAQRNALVIFIRIDSKKKPHPNRDLFIKQILYFYFACCAFIKFSFENILCKNFF